MDAGDSFLCGILIVLTSTFPPCDFPTFAVDFRREIEYGRYWLINMDNDYEAQIPDGSPRAIVSGLLKVRQEA